MTADEERAAIVAYLRHHSDMRFNWDESDSSSTLDEFADALERLAHHERNGHD